MTRPPVTQCGYPVAKRHDPWCTGRKRLVDGCWCFLRREGEPKLTARQWRAARRRHARYERAWRRELAHTGVLEFEDQLIRRALNRRARIALAGRTTTP
jgi:hypothetical protein